MRHLNYSRDLAYQTSLLLKNTKKMPELFFNQVMGYSKSEAVEAMTNVLRLHEQSVKFILPKGGRVIDDKRLKGLDDSVELHLPFKITCFEYESVELGSSRPEDAVLKFKSFDGEILSVSNTQSVPAPKRVIYAEEFETFIALTIAFYTTDFKIWRVLPDCFLPKKNYLLPMDSIEKGFRPFKVFFQPGLSPKNFPMTDYFDELGAFIGFLNASMCSNTEIVKSPAKKLKLKKTQKQGKNPYTFNDYHFLTINISPGANNKDADYKGTHRSPREHLRRGHIRVLQCGKRVWVNAAVINPGVNGHIKKEYTVCA